MTRPEGGGRKKFKAELPENLSPTRRLETFDLPPLQGGSSFYHYLGLKPRLSLTSLRDKSDSPLFRGTNKMRPHTFKEMGNRQKPYG